MVKLLKSKWLLAGAVLLVIWMTASFVKIRTHDKIVNKEVGDLEGKIAVIEENNSALEQLLEYMTHPLFLEREAREKLNYKAPGEDVAFVYTDDSRKTASASDDFNRQLAQMPNYLKWWWYMWGY